MSEKPRLNRANEKSDVPATLERLAGYYLKCLSYERDGEISLSPNSGRFRPQYLQIDHHPSCSETFSDIWSSDDSKDFLVHLRKDPARHMLYVGFPIFVRTVKGQITIEPLFLFPLSLSDRSAGIPTLVDEPPRFNQAAFQGYGPVNGGHLFDELLLLRDELGLASESGEMPCFEDWIAKLQSMRPEWPWAGTMDPHKLTSTPIHELEPSKIHNCALICSNTQAGYTRGLEAELSKIASVAKNPDFEHSALYCLLDPEALPARPNSDETPVLEVLRLNKEQRSAVQKVLDGKITVITGPPGTGKSQVVAAILANAAMRGWKTLVASKNHKAVDVVATRVNALAASPFLLHLNALSGSQNLEQQITHILSSSHKAPVGKQERLDKEYQALSDERRQHETAIDQLVELRNTVDNLDREIAAIRRRLDGQVLDVIKNAPAHSFSEVRHEVDHALTKSDRSKVSWFERLIWNLIAKSRAATLSAAVEKAKNLLSAAGLISGSTASVSASELVVKLREAEGLKSTFDAFDSNFSDLKSKKPLETHYAALAKIDELIVNKGVERWKSFLDQRYTSLTQQDRRLLGEYAGIVALANQANLQNSQVATDVKKRLKTLTNDMSRIFTSSAITALSVQGRIPFEPAILDLVIIDEASQCDIASALPLLLRAKRAVIIGDPQQLSHITQLSARQDAALLQEFGLQSHASWGYSQNSLFMKIAASCRSEDIVGLVEHHRSAHDIISFSNRFFYRDKLRIATRPSRIMRDKNEPAVEWLDVAGTVTKISGKGAVNVEEAQAIANYIEDLIVRKGFTGSVGVVTPFRGQANRIREYITNKDGLEIGGSGLLVDTVHKFQGDERDMMVFSPVVSDGISESALGFLSKQGNLFNVAITRARSRLVVIGNKNACADPRVPYLSAFVKHAEEVVSRHGDPTVVEGFFDSPEYPEVANPEHVSNWERHFYKVLNRAGIRTIPQYQVDEYRLDFAIIDGDRKLNIEVDGELYHRNWDGELVLRDQLRNRRLIEQGWSVLRFWVYELRDHEPDCIERIQKWLNQK